MLLASLRPPFVDSRAPDWDRLDMENFEHRHSWWWGAYELIPDSYKVWSICRKWWEVGTSRILEELLKEIFRMNQSPEYLVKEF